MKGKIISIDLGTMGVKVSLVNFDGTVEKSYHHEYPVITEKENHVEQDPRQWWTGIVKGIRKISEEENEIDAISMCGQMHTHVYLDRDGEVLGRAITWLDQRSREIIDDWEKGGLIDDIFEKTWVRLTTTYTLPQVFWMKKNQPDIFSKTSHILLAKDYVKYLLTGKMVTDPSDASGIGGFDIRRKEWVSDVFETLGISPDLFPRVEPSTKIVAHLSNESAKILKIKSGIPVVNGGSDHSISEIGAGMFKEKTATCILGTAGVLAVCSNEPVKDEKGKIVCWAYPIEEYWDVLGITQTAAASLTWFRDVFDPNESDIFEEYSRMAEKVQAGSNGLIFLPYLVGERTPHWDPKAKGVFFGLKISHRKEHFIRAIMEGVAYSIKDCAETMEEFGITFERLNLIGGGSKSRVWRKIISNVLGKDVVIPMEKDTSAMGNLVLTLLGLGILKDARDAAEFLKIEDEISPDRKEVVFYRNMFEKYKQIYRNTMKIMHDL